ncbi:uncharacterized protein METZ01_LOCUS355553, partial [marine metagenome]
MDLTVFPCSAWTGNTWFLHPIATRQSGVIPIFLSANGRNFWI